MKQLLIICALCAACFSIGIRPDGGPECRCTLPARSDIAMNKAYDETSLGNGGFKLTAGGESWCDELAQQRRLIESSLRRTSLETSACHQLLKAERNGRTVAINYFVMKPEEVEKICEDLGRRKKRTLSGKAPIRFEMLCMNDYMVVVTSEGRDDTELKAVMVLLGVDPE